MTEAIVCLLICASDWGCAASHMAFNAYTWQWPYSKRIPIWGDLWHFVAAWRYLGLIALAWLGFGAPLSFEWAGWHHTQLHWNWNLEWYLGTALLNSAGWYMLKVAHGKVGAWGWKPRWLKQITR